MFLTLYNGSITSTSSYHLPTVKAEERKGARENLKNKICSIINFIETHPQDIERYDPLGAMDHLKTGSDRQLKSHVEHQVTCLQVEQAVRQVAPPVSPSAIPGMILKVMHRESKGPKRHLRWWPCHWLTIFKKEKLLMEA